MQGGGPVEEVRRSRHVAPAEGAAPRRGEPLSGPTGELFAMPGARLGFANAERGLLQMVPDELLDLREAQARLFLEPVAERLVQRPTKHLRDGPIGRLLDEDVLEPEGFVVEEARADWSEEILPDERVQMTGQRRPSGIGQQLYDGAWPELPSGDCRSLQHRSLSGTQAIEARGKDRLDRRRDREVSGGGPSLGYHGRDLLEEQRIAFCGLPDRATDSWAERGRPRLRAEQRVALLGIEWSQVDREGIGPTAAPPTRPVVEQLGPGKAEEYDRRVASPAREMFDQGEQRRLRPMDVFENHQHGARPGDALKQATDGPERLLDAVRAVGATDSAGDAAGDERSFRISIEQPLDRAVGCRLVHDLVQRPERDPVAIRQASTGEDQGTAFDG